MKLAAPAFLLALGLIALTTGGCGGRGGGGGGGGGDSGGLVGDDDTYSPPVPEGGSDSLRYLLREFYSSDATVGSGLTGLMNWHGDSGYELQNEGATADDGAKPFLIDDLQPDDLAALPLPEDGRDLSLANGVVSVSTSVCSWKRAEELTVRADQDVVLSTFDSYSRSYETSRTDFEDASEAMTFTPITTQLADVFSDSFDAEGVSSSVLMTLNSMTETSLAVTMDYSLVTHFRHGVFGVQEWEVPVFMVLSWLPEATEGSNSSHSLEQSYSLEVFFNLKHQRLRIVGNWSEIDSDFLDTDSPLWRVASVNMALQNSERLSAICGGEIDLPDEG